MASTRQRPVPNVLRAGSLLTKPRGTKTREERGRVHFATSEATSAVSILQTVTAHTTNDSCLFNSLVEDIVALENSAYLSSQEVLPSDHFSPITLLTISQNCYPYISQLMQLDSCRPPSNPVLPTLTAITSPFSPDTWEAALTIHPDRAFVSYLLSGLKHGFRIGFDRRHHLIQAKDNMPSTKNNPDVVTAYLRNEAQARRIIGPLSLPENQTDIHISRFGVIPKQHQPCKWRLILDLSCPQEACVNAGISRDLCSLQYVTVDHAAKIISELGDQIAKIDIARAYRNVPVHSNDRQLLGMQWQGQIFVDTVLPFDLRSAPKLFCTISDALEWILVRRGLSQFCTT